MLAQKARMRSRYRTPLAARMVFMTTVLVGFVPMEQVMAQTVERNPFAPPPAAERIEAAERDRVLRITQDIVRGEMAKLEKSVSETIERRLLGNIDRRVEALGKDIRKDVDGRLGDGNNVSEETKKNLQAIVLETLKRNPQAVGPTENGKTPEPPAFVACVNGKALYRDKDGSTFYSDETDLGLGDARCDS